MKQLHRGSLKNSTRSRDFSRERHRHSVSIRTSKNNTGKQYQRRTLPNSAPSLSRNNYSRRPRVDRKNPRENIHTFAKVAEKDYNGDRWRCRRARAVKRSGAPAIVAVDKSRSSLPNIPAVHRSLVCPTLYVRKHHIERLQLALRASSPLSRHNGAPSSLYFTTAARTGRRLRFTVQTSTRFREAFLHPTHGAGSIFIPTLSCP